MEYEQRLRRLERRSQRTQLTLLICGVLVAAAFLVAAGRANPQPDIEASSLTILDEDGRQRVLVSAKELTFFDESGGDRVHLGVDHLTILGEDGKQGVRLGTHKARGCSVALVDNKGVLRLLVGLTGGGRGNPIIAFFDSKERTRAYFHHDSVDDTESPALKLFDEDGTRRAELSLNSLGDPRLGEFDAKGQVRTIVGVRVDIDKATWTETRTAENQISMYDANGKIVWQAPPQENEPK